MKKHSQNWGGHRPGAGRKTHLSEEMVRVTRRYIERLSEDANNPATFIYQLFTETEMPATQVKQITRAEAEKLVASQHGWHEAKLEPGSVN